MSIPEQPGGCSGCSGCQTGAAPSATQPPSDARTVDEYIAEQKTKLGDNPECANTYYNLGMGYLSKRMFKEAEEAFLKAVDCSPKLVEAFVQLGGIAMNRGDIGTCLRYNEIAAKTMPLFAVPWANIGFCYLQEGEADQAIAAFKKAVKKDPSFVQAIASMAAAYFMKGELDESIRLSKKALEVEPKFGPAYNNLALVYLEKGDHQAAIENLDKAVESGFEPPEGLVKELDGYRK